MAKYSNVDVKAFSSNSVQIAYPNLEINVVNPTLPLIVGMLEEGTMPLVAHWNGDVRIIKYISPSAINVKRILDTQQDIVYNLSKDRSVIINTIKDYLEEV